MRALRRSPYAVLVLELTLAASCTVSNPLYTPGGLDGGVPDAARGDLSQGGTVDLLSSAADLALAPDLASCTGDTRSCTATGSALCVAGVPEPDRTCPSGSSCVNGYCAPPTNGQGRIGRRCDFGAGPQENQCIGSGSADIPSCQPFVDAVNKEIRWVCGHPVGSGVPGTACSTGGECRSGFCGSNGTCFRACQLALDCPVGQKLDCVPVEIEVEGIKVTEGSCTPA